MADPTGTPDLARANAWVGPAALSHPTAELQLMLDSAIDKVISSCVKPEDLDPELDPPFVLPVPLQESILRRFAKSVASKGIPLGVIVGDTEFQGPITIRRWDAEIEDREEFYRRWSFA